MTEATNHVLVLTPRDRLILETLGTTRVLASDQIKVIGGFSSTRRTNRRLLKLVEAGVLRRWFTPTQSGGQRAIYGLSPIGASEVGGSLFSLISAWKQDSLITVSQFLAHQQAVNSMFIAVRFETMPPGVTCRRWLAFKGTLSSSVPLIPDGYFEIVRETEVLPMFLEVDLGTESSTVWKRKVELYLKFAIGGEFERLFHEKRFRVLVVLPSERRLDSIRKTVAKRTDKLFWFSTQEQLRTEKLWKSTWQRPVGEAKVCLI